MIGISSNDWPIQMTLHKNLHYDVALLLLRDLFLPVFLDDDVIGDNQVRKYCIIDESISAACDITYFQWDLYNKYVDHFS